MTARTEATPPEGRKNTSMDRKQTATLAERLECAQRELRTRRDAYPGLVHRGKMNAAEAAYELRVMGEIVKDYAEAVERDPQGAGLLL